eukprot:scaffold1798_cov376-Prasinococcus_capsulatus_cf.AAC.1
MNHEGKGTQNARRLATGLATREPPPGALAAIYVRPGEPSSSSRRPAAASARAGCGAGRRMAPPDSGGTDDAAAACGCRRGERRLE